MSLFKPNFFYSTLVKNDTNTALEKYDNCIEDFYHKGESIVECNCPTCRSIIKFNCYNPNDKSLITDGTLVCTKCDNYMDYKLIKHNDELRMLIRSWDRFKDLDINKKFDQYMIDNLSMDDWKLIFSVVDLDDPMAVSLKRIKSTLESNGVVFDN